MLARSFSALAVLALATHVVAEPQPYKPQVMKTSVRDLFGLVRRDDIPGYRPTQDKCGEGDTCEQACGAGFQTCASNDDLVHCFNPTASEICCPNRSGKACDAGYYCTSDKAGETWCCPDDLSIQACAAAYNVDGGLVSQTAVPSGLPTAKPSGGPIKNGTYGGPKSSPSGAPTAKPTGSWSPANLTGTAGGPPAPTSTLITGAASMAAPASGLALLLGAVAALL